MRTTRREAMFGLAATALVLPGCGKREVRDPLAWAGRLNDSKPMMASVAWIEPNDYGGRTAAVAYVPSDLTPEQRHAVVANKGVYPVLPGRAEMLEVRMDMARPGKDQGFGLGTLREVKLTFWNWDEPTPVVAFERDEWAPSPDLSIDGFDGNFVPGGWLDGVVRGHALVKDERGRDEYVWNLQLAMSLD